MKTTLRIFLAVVPLATLSCGHSATTPDAGVDAGVQVPPCVNNPVTYTDILNACTTAQSGDPAKDYPYFPQLAPGGVLPSLP